MNELQTTGTELTTNVASEPAPLQLVASTAEQMQAAQTQLLTWFSGKLTLATRDANDANENLRIAEANGFQKGSFERLQKSAWRRVAFYEKCVEAVKLGYALVPNFPVDVFAVRTEKRRPRRNEATYNRGWKQQSEGPAQGEGAYVDADPLIGEWKSHDPKTSREVTHYFADAFAPEIEYPLSVAEPRVMAATVAAMEHEIFDEIGVLPERRRAGDPIVVGRIVDHVTTRNRRVISFLISWYIDTRVL